MSKDRVNLNRCLLTLHNKIANSSNSCTEWRKGLRRVWNLPYDAHCEIVTGLSGGVSILDELCKRSLSFVAKCLRHSSGLIRFITSHGISFAAGVSLMGKNVTFCSAIGITLKLVILRLEL